MVIFITFLHSSLWRLRGSLLGIVLDLLSGVVVFVFITLFPSTLCSGVILHHVVLVVSIASSTVISSTWSSYPRWHRIYMIIVCSVEREKGV